MILAILSNLFRRVADRPKLLGRWGYHFENVKHRTYYD